MKVSEISIVIPTVKYSGFLDQAIESALDLKYVHANIYINIGSMSEDFKFSKYWDDTRINWLRVDEDQLDKNTGYLMTYANINDGIKKSSGDWIFILCDDDIIRNDFLKDVIVNELNWQDLYLINFDIIDEENKFLREGEVFQETEISNEKLCAKYLSGKIQNHLSMFVFSRRMWMEVGCFPLTYGYPNGYYGDTIFNGKLLANAQKILVGYGIVFSRRESRNQESSKFFIDKSVNQYFEQITDALMEDEKFKLICIDKYGDKNAFRDDWLFQRFKVELSKIFNKQYINKPKPTRLLTNVILGWHLKISTKIKVIIYSVGYIPFKILKNLKS